LGGGPISSPFGTKPIATTSWSASLWSDGLPVTVLQLTSKTTSPAFPAPCTASLGHLSPFFHEVFVGSDFGPSHTESELSDTDQPPYFMNLPRVALLPASDAVYGWMWMKPSPWVWIPARTPGFPAGVSNVAGLLSHSPQMFTPNAACQWSWPGCGGPADEEGGLIASTTPPMPTTRIAAIAM